MKKVLALALALLLMSVPSLAEPSPSPVENYRDASQEEINTVQHRLIELGWLHLSKPTGFYDKATKQALIDFEKYTNNVYAAGLSEGGSASRRTNLWLFDEDALTNPALEPTGVVKPNSQFYVLDEANVLSSSTEKYIVENNARLYEACGAQIVFVTIDSFGVADRADYAYKLFNDWGIGSKEKNNGVLILLAVDDDDGYFLQGRGIERNLTSGELGELVDKYLMPYFDQKDYDTGCKNLFDALLEKVAGIYGADLSAPALAEPTPAPNPYPWLEVSPGVYFGGNTSRDNPAPLGDTINWGHEEEGEPSQYFELTVGQVLRGNEALELIKQRYQNNDGPPEGKEYIYLNLKVKGQARDSSQRFNFSAWDVELVSEGGNIYEQCTPTGFERSAKFFAGASGNIEVTAFIDSTDHPLILFDNFAWMATE